MTVPPGKHPNSLANLAKNREQRAFGTPGGNPQSQNIKGGNKPWSVRMSLRHLGAQRIDPLDAKSIENLLPDQPTLSQYVAAKTWAKAAAGDMRAVQHVTEQVDGKVTTTNHNADFAAILEMSDDELLDYTAQLIGELEALDLAEADSNRDREEEQARSPIIIENEDERGGETPDPAGV